MAWLYLYSGKAQVIYDDIENPIELNSGEMLALVEGAEPMPMDRSIAAGLHPVLDEAPILEVIEPSLKARLENRLVKAGISIAQAITFVSYSLSLVVLIGIPIFALLRRATHRQGISHLRDIIKGVFVSRR
jgi:hypothetical protein